MKNFKIMDKYCDVLSKFNMNLNDGNISSKVSDLIGKKFDENNTRQVRNFLYSCIDLTSLNTDDYVDKIWKFTTGVNDFDGTRPDVGNVAAICVFPNFVGTVKEALTADVKITAVAGGFPSSQTFPEIKIAEVSLAVTDGADEIDIVINAGAFFEDDMETFCNEIMEIKDACKEARLKVILETGLLKTAENIKKASVLSMYSGADFLKTSTGKVYAGATPEAVYVMCETIKEYYNLHNKKIGIKVSGGVRTPEDAVKYYTIVKEVLGEEWLAPEYFRLGASALANSLLE